MLEALFSGDIQGFLISLMLSLPIVFLALSLHETAHGLIACKLGDPTAKSLGRLTLNPLKHLDPLGFICMILFGFGWAKPVPINTRYFKKPKRDMALTALAGPVSNLLLALIFALLLRLDMGLVAHLPLNTEFAYLCWFWSTQFLWLGVTLNVSLAVFNLIPIPPFDGSRIFLSMLPTKIYFKIMQYEQYLYILLMVLLVLGVLDGPLDFITNKFLDLIFRITFFDYT